MTPYCWVFGDFCILQNLVVCLYRKLRELAFCSYLLRSKKIHRRGHRKKMVWICLETWPFSLLNDGRVEHQGVERTCTVDMVGNDVVDLFAVESKGTECLRKEWRWDQQLTIAMGLTYVDIKDVRQQIWPPGINSCIVAPEKRSSPKWNFIFQPLIFRGKLLVSGRVTF